MYIHVCGFLKMHTGRVIQMALESSLVPRPADDGAYVDIPIVVAYHNRH